PGCSSPARSWRSTSSRPFLERRRLTTFELGRALLDERLDAFARVLRLRAHILGERLELERAAQVRLLAVIERALGQPDRDRRAGGDLSRQLVRGRQALFRLVDRVHDPEAERLLSVDD